MHHNFCDRPITTYVASKHILHPPSREKTDLVSTTIPKRQTQAIIVEHPKKQSRNTIYDSTRGQPPKPLPKPSFRTSSRSGGRRCRGLEPLVAPP